MKLKEKFNKKDGQNKKEKKPLKQRIRESTNGKYLRNGSYSVMISAIFIVIVIVINMIVGSLHISPEASLRFRPRNHSGQPDRS